MDQRVADADRELTYLKDSLATIDLRLATKEDLLRKQFTAMESGAGRLAVAVVQSGQLARPAEPADAKASSSGAPGRLTEQ